MIKVLTFALFLLGILASESSAGVILRECKTYYSANPTASVNSSIFTISAANPQVITAKLYSSYNSGTNATLDVKIQSCDKNDSTAGAPICSDQITFDRCTTSTCGGGDGLQNVDLNSMVAHTDRYFRVVSTLGGTSPNYNVRVDICTD